jgi:hypothetical protein
VALIWFITWVRARIALPRATRSTRTASTVPVRAFGMVVARPPATACAAA